MLTDLLTSALPDATAALSAVDGSHVVALGPDWLDARNMISGFIERFGVYAVFGIVAVVFIETGLLFPFLPGDSLLFTAGLLVAQDELNLSIWLVCGMIFAAAFLGDQLAYLIGNKIGPRLFKPDARVLKTKYIDQAHDYFERFGGRTVILARFVPFLRTFAPVAAGMSGMRYRTFVVYNLIGAFVWGVGVTLLGYWLGNVQFVNDHIETILVLIVAVSVIPVVIEVLRARRESQRVKAQGTSALADAATVSELAAASATPAASTTGEAAAAPAAPPTEATTAPVTRPEKSTDAVEHSPGKDD
ncbi:DedA family protein [Oerskovia paurometabola]|uniref:DedA family protein n=1 Tax=Oerskovia paurometabola TaxID=162170 RepID=A0ABW1X6H0_9CELL|nr:VTT domain-containing protein [Oerskovia paurometabola]MBM7495909.1 membrane-associated protein [Oerskovia paurometabola]